MIGGDVGHARVRRAAKCGLEMEDMARIEGIGEDLVLEMA